MNMTHYMELLAINQPWNLIIFMAIPIVLAETLAITEFYLLFTRKFEGLVFQVNKFSGIAVGLYFLGIIYYIMTNAVIPITKAGEWRTVIDVIAVGSYVIAGLPLVWIAFQELGIVNRSMERNEKLKVHAICVSFFLIFGHVAMITGMLDPGILGYEFPASTDMNHDMNQHVEHTHQTK